jgi:hypothetical protein
MDKKKLALALLLLSAPAFGADLTITVQKANGQIVVHEASNAWSAGPFQNAAAVRAWVLSVDPTDSSIDVIMKALIKSVAQTDVNLAQTYQSKVYTVTVPDPTVVAAP